MEHNDKPVIVVVDPADDRSATAEQLSERYGASYVISSASTADEAVGQLVGFAQRQQEVALILADRATGGSAVLDRGRDVYPHARRGLLLEWNESRSHREQIAIDFARRRAECFVTKPIGAYDERFHRSITELLDEWWRLRGPATVGVRVLGRERSPRIREMLDLLQRHDVPHTFEFAEVDEPVIVLHNGRTLVDPTNVEVADALGARTRPGVGVYDVVVVGGGPAGLSAAVYAESEGLRTALIEPTAMGGQAGTSSMIRNYLGFPRGISGAELAARAFEQAILFGTEMIYGQSATGLRDQGDLRVVELSDGFEVPGRAVVIATGVSYRMLGVAALQRFQGAGVFYGAAMSEAPDLQGRRAFVVGGGNSAGQAAIHLAAFAQHVTILVRRDSLAASMSEYLITEIDATANIDVRSNTEVVDGDGAARLERLTLRDTVSGVREVVDAGGLFVLIGGTPFTDWLPGVVHRDEWGYVTTGPTAAGPDHLQFESTMPGVFAVGDVRRGSIKRVASAVGEGAVCVRLVHDFLARTGDRV